DIAAALDEEREPERVADGDAGAIDRHPIDGDAGRARPARLAGREQWVLAWIEAENEAAGQPLADLDVEVQLGRVQEDGVRDQPGEILASPGNHLDRPAQRQEFVDPRTDLGAANDRPRRILLGRPGLLEVADPPVELLVRCRRIGRTHRRLILRLGWRLGW